MFDTVAISSSSTLLLDIRKFVLQFVLKFDQY